LTDFIFESQTGIISLDVGSVRIPILIFSVPFGVIGFLAWLVIFDSVQSLLEALEPNLLLIQLVAHGLHGLECFLHVFLS